MRIALDPTPFRRIRYPPWGVPHAVPRLSRDAVRSMPHVDFPPSATSVSSTPGWPTRVLRGVGGRLHRVVEQSPFGFVSVASHMLSAVAFGLVGFAMGFFAPHTQVRLRHATPHDRQTACVRGRPRTRAVCCVRAQDRMPRSARMTGLRGKRRNLRRPSGGWCAGASLAAGGSAGPIVRCRRPAPRYGCVGGCTVRAPVMMATASSIVCDVGEITATLRPRR